MKQVIRYWITGYLCSRGHFYVGTGEQQDIVDLPLYRNGTGMSVIPGTSIAGALRQHATRLANLVASKMKNYRCQRVQTGLGEGDQNKACQCVVCQ
ncbi:MAG: RAMP superfamily CRISPR-associated protein, partial [Candidatus Thorarchaeota archaeon]